MATLNDKFLLEAAKAYNNESYDMANYLTVSTDTTAVTTTDTTIGDELGSRISLSTSRSGNIVSQSAIRSSVDVVDNVNGDDINKCGFALGSSGGDFHLISVVNGVVQQTTFDIEFVNQLEPVRK